MPKYAVNIDQVETTELPGRTVRVLSAALPVKNMTFGICEVPPHSAMNPHNHAQEEIIYFLQGRGYVEIGGTKETVLAGTLVHFPSDVKHVIVNEGDEIMRFSFCFSPQVVVGSYDSK